jgi:TolA-binding protein
VEFLNDLDWTQIMGFSVVAVGGWWSARWAWSKLPKSEQGGPAALAAVQAAAAAVKLHDQVTDERIEQLEERVHRLEQIIVENNKEKERLLRRIADLDSEIDYLLRWVAALMEQLKKAGVIPLRYEEIRHRNPTGDFDDPRV